MKRLPVSVLILAITATVLISGCTTTEQISSSPEPTGFSDVIIKDFAFTPADLTISAGMAVRWTNEDSTTHTIKSDTSGEFDSGVIGTGTVFEHTFETKGEYTYHCSIHPSMKGKITVE